MKTEELFDLLKRCSELSIRGNTKAIQQASALVERITALETALEEIREKAVDAQGEWSCVAETYLGEDVLPIREIENVASAALLGETK